MMEGIGMPFLIRNDTLSSLAIEALPKGDLITTR